MVKPLLRDSSERNCFVKISSGEPWEVFKWYLLCDESPLALKSEPL